ncbi:hypothetical protein M441DRAFT_148953, partial [Trichoderma asperellum CBS 433.97]
YNKLPTKDKRLVVEAFESALTRREHSLIPFRKKGLIFLRWEFRCPKCKIEKPAEYFVANKFTLSVPRDEDSEPLLISRRNCTKCGN